MSSFDYAKANRNGACLPQKRKISESDDVCNELRQENLELRRQYQKLVEDLRDKITQVDYAEDKIIRLERCLESHKKQQRTVTQSMEKKIEEYRRTVLQQSDAVEITKDLLMDKTSRLTRIEKELQAMKEERDASQSELEKACDEVEWYQNYNTALKCELKKNLEISERQRCKDAAKLEDLELENARVTADLEQLRASFRRLEYERIELEEAIAKTRTHRDDTHFVQQNTIYDSDQEVIMDSDVLLGTAFPPVQPGESLLSEMQSLMVLPVSTVNVNFSVVDACTQTDEDPLPIYISSVEDTTLNKTVEVQNSKLNLGSYPTPESSIENQSIELANDRCTVITEDVTVSNNLDFKMLQPIDHRRNTVSMGVIPDEHHERMIQYAFDVPRRSCQKEAAILSRREWRTLRGDLDQVDQETFKKTFGQDEDPDEVGPYRATRKADDLDEVAETYCEQFPFLAESLFEHLQGITAATATLEDLPYLKARFEELAYTFRTDHDQLDRREQIVKIGHSGAINRLENLSASLKQAMLTIRSQKMPGEMRELFNNVEQMTSTIEGLTSSLDESAKKIGRLDVLSRVFRFIEVMVLYVRVLKTVCGKTEDERNLARKLLLDAGIPFEALKHAPPTSLQIKENNNLVPGMKLQLPIDSSTGIGKTNSPRRSFLGNFLRLRRADIPRTPVESLNFNVTNTKRSSNIQTTLFRSRDWILHEFTWPWDGRKTWNGLRKAFAMILMLLAILLILKITSIPSCGTSFSVRSLFGMSHKYPPRI